MSAQTAATPTAPQASKPDTATLVERVFRAREAAQRGTAVVIASTDDAELCDTCDRILVVRDGRITAELQGDCIAERELGRLQLGRAA